jgi:hypothetical protein
MGAGVAFRVLKLALDFQSGKHFLKMLVATLVFSVCARG